MSSVPPDAKFFVSCLGCLWNTTKKKQISIYYKNKNRKNIYTIVKETYFIVLFILYVHKSCSLPFFFPAPRCARVWPPLHLFPFFSFSARFLLITFPGSEKNIYLHTQSNHRILPVPPKSVGSLLVVVCPPAVPAVVGRKAIRTAAALWPNIALPASREEGWSEPLACRRYPVLRLVYTLLEPCCPKRSPAYARSRACLGVGL